ncbi:hypothetical protein K505DRAFT_367721 [Melanomma pulvis-pyrius CBS 109.77]|uniref:Uncharacterized protein n=1 Tax=Melanomma pulvis-pyrius CBS 109.77 TaxID=1314802 RepID=A0A6A6WSW8_9PLEO|nr:hypothetical protein K505DRAFT_367721 [Melanomma pulvis-pyrius CBS 109.77]
MEGFSFLANALRRIIWPGARESNAREPASERQNEAHDVEFVTQQLLLSAARESDTMATAVSTNVRESGAPCASEGMHFSPEEIVRVRDMCERKNRAHPESANELRVRLMEMRFEINVSRARRGLPLLKRNTANGKGRVEKERVGGAREARGQKKVLAHVERAKELRWWLEGMCGPEKIGGLKRKRGDTLRDDKEADGGRDAKRLNVDPSSSKRKRCDTLGDGEGADGGRDPKRLHIDSSSSKTLHAKTPREVRALRRSSRQNPNPSQNSAPVRIPGLTLIYSD